MSPYRAEMEWVINLVPQIKNPFGNLDLMLGTRSELAEWYVQVAVYLGTAYRIEFSRVEFELGRRLRSVPWYNCYEVLKLIITINSL